MTVEYQVVYWRDIPAQVRVRENRQKGSRPLATRFQVAIDEAAMRAGATGAEDYLADWHTSAWQAYEGDFDSALDTLVSDLEARYTPTVLRALIAHGGRE